MRSGGLGFLLFLTFLNILNFIDRQLLSSFANWIVPELGLSNTQFGLLTGLVFIFFYAVMGLFMGTLVDRMNRSRLIAAGVGLWSGLTALSGMAQGFVSLALPRVFIGVGESILTPAAMSLFGDRFPAKWLGVATGIYDWGCLSELPRVCLSSPTWSLSWVGVAASICWAPSVLYLRQQCY